ncbi:MAG: PD40 domain-containing protein [Saprospiraceae bacterium]|nr:PD40 domain-containing protein [Saprospiraceae bacterium]
MVNTKAEESSPRFSPDGNYFFFGREYKQNLTKTEFGVFTSLKQHS